MRYREAGFVAFMLQLASVYAQMNSQLPNTTFFLPIVNVGSNASGTPVPLYGCITDGSTLQQLSFWANSQWIRGMQAGLTDGRLIQAGCLNVTGNVTGNGCTDSNIRSANFTFQSGERISTLTIYPGYNVQGKADQRAGALNLTTSYGRNFSFGMTAAWANGTSIDVGEGIPCGVYPLAGADVDSLGFIFLRDITANALQSIQYSGVSSGSSGDLSDDVAPLQESALEVVISNQTYNNSGQTTSLDATSAAQADLTTSSRWTYALGLDSYTVAPANGSIPQVVDYSTNANVSWSLQEYGLYNRSVSSQNNEAWNYSVTVAPGAASRVTATATQGNITATFTANLNVSLDSGASFSVPVSGLYMGSSMSPVHVQVQELTAAAPAAAAASLSDQSTKGGSGDNTVPWVVGLLVGLICGLLLAALLAWAVVLIMRRRNKRAQNPQTSDADQASPKSRGCLPGPLIPALFGKSKGVVPGDVQKDVELGAAPGKNNNKWIVEDDPKLAAAPVMGVPWQAAPEKSDQPAPSQEGDLPESEGRHVMPYNMFRRLRLNDVRQNVGLESPDLTPLSRAQAKLDGLEKLDEGSKSQMPASGPRNTPEVVVTAQPGTSSDTGAESIESHPRPGPQGQRRSAIEEDDKVPLFLDNPEDEKEAVLSQDDERRQKLRDEIAHRMAHRRSTPERRALKDTMMHRISNQIASYGPQSGSAPSNPAGLKKEALQKHAIRHENQSLKLGAGYKSTRPLRDLEKNVVKHGDDRIKLGVKYETQGCNK